MMLMTGFLGFATKYVAISSRYSFESAFLSPGDKILASTPRWFAPATNFARSLLIKCLITMIFVSAALPGFATTWNSNGSDTDTQSKINSAAVGDTVALPSDGSFTWNSTVTVDNGVLLNLNGSTITRGTGTGDLLDLNCNITNELRVTGGTFIQNTTSYQIMTINGSFSNSVFRLDHCNFNTTTGGSVLLNIETVWGVIDHCSFSAPLNSEMIHNIAYGPGTATGWQDVITPGSLNAVYIENCAFTNNDPALLTSNPAYFYGNSAIQGYYGSRTVLRYNTFFMSQIDMHGNTDFGARWWEIYSNTWSMVANGNQSTFCDLRAGSGVVFGNHLNAPSNAGGGSLHLGTDGGGDSENYGPPGKGIINSAGVASIYPAYAWGNDSSMPVNAEGALNTAYYLSTRPGYTPAVYPHPLVSGTSAPAKYTLTVVNGTGSGSYSSNSVVSISANTISGELFANWSGLDIANGNSASTTVTMPGTNLTVTANFAINPAPTVPTGLVAVAVSTNQINLNWQASTDIVGVTGYVVQRSQGAGSTSFTQLATPTGTNYSDAGLTAATTYNYQVEATDAAGNVSGYSSVASATTAWPPGVAPTAPVFYNAVSNINTSGTISTLTTPSLPNGGNNPIFLYCIAWYDSSVALSTVTNNLGVPGTAIATNVWADITGGLGWDVTYYWGNSGMTSVTAVFGSAPGEITSYLVQCTNGPASSPYVGAVVTNNYLAGSNLGTYITNIVSSTPNSLVVSFSVENAANAGAPTVGVLPVTSIGTAGSTGYHFETAAYKSGAVSVTNDATWSDSSAVQFDLTSVSIVLPATNPPPSYTLTVVNGSGSGNYAAGAVVNIAAGTISGQYFTNWSGSNIANTNAATTTVTMPAGNLTVTANFATNPPPSYALTVVNGSGSGNYAVGAVVNITASTISGQYFTNWSGSNIANANAATTTVTMPAGNLTVTANFANNSPATYALTVVNGSGSGNYAAGAVVNITASTISGQYFTNWSGSNIANANAATTTVTMPAGNLTVTANFANNSPATYVLTVVNGTGSGTYNPDAVVSISANPNLAANGSFTNWSGANIANTNSANTTVTMPASNSTVTANFIPPPPSNLRVAELP
jgi:hypothetical protein